MAKKKPNMQDATLKNTRAANKRIAKLEAGQKHMFHRLQLVERLVKAGVLKKK